MHKPGNIEVQVEGDEIVITLSNDKGSISVSRSKSEFSDLVKPFIKGPHA